MTLSKKKHNELLQKIYREIYAILKQENVTVQDAIVTLDTMKFDIMLNDRILVINGETGVVKK